MRKIKGIKNASGLTTNTKLHQAEKANRAMRFMAYIDSKLVPVTTRPVLVSIKPPARDIAALEKAHFEAEFSQVNTVNGGVK